MKEILDRNKYGHFEFDLALLENNINITRAIIFYTSKYVYYKDFDAVKQWKFSTFIALHSEFIKFIEASNTYINNKNFS
jgi:hypothetical protein